MMMMMNQFTATLLLALVSLVGSSFGYPVEHFPRGNKTLFAMERTVWGGLQVFGLGSDAQIWHVFQRQSGEWGNWTAITSICPSAQDPKRKCVFDTDPAVGRNRDGRLELFARFNGNLDLWQMYQPDAAKPGEWSLPREPSCVDQDQFKPYTWHCLEPRDETNYWVSSTTKGRNGNPVFPTSDTPVLYNQKTGAIQVFFRNFNAQLYMVEQAKAGNSSRYKAPVLVSSLDFV